MELYKTIGNYNIDITHPLGEGTFSIVYKAYHVDDPNLVAAVKTVPLAKFQKNQTEISMFMREINILRQIKSEHIVQLLDVKMTKNNLYIFMEYCEESLKTQLAKKRKYNEEEACDIVRQITNAFISLDTLPLSVGQGQKMSVMHRDIKPDNILFSKGKVKVADFGFAKVICARDKHTRRVHSICGTPMYEAPQIIGQKMYSAKCDVWSTGVLFFEILCGCLPWEVRTHSDLVEAIHTRPIHFPINTISSETKDLINKMLMISEEDRISWSEISKHPALSKKKKAMPTFTNFTFQPLKDLNFSFGQPPPKSLTPRPRIDNQIQIKPGMSRENSPKYLGERKTSVIYPGKENKMLAEVSPLPQRTKNLNIKPSRQLNEKRKDLVRKLSPLPNWVLDKRHM